MLCPSLACGVSPSSRDCERKVLMIEVVSAVVVKDGRMLLAQRPLGKDYTYCWETPGGKIDGPHESHHDAVRRELFEELGLEVGEIHQNALWSGEVALEGRKSIFLLFYVVHDWTGLPVPRERQGFG